jgi:hypothetical protein
MKPAAARAREKIASWLDRDAVREGVSLAGTFGQAQVLDRVYHPTRPQKKVRSNQI